MRSGFTIHYITINRSSGVEENDYIIKDCCCIPDNNTEIKIYDKYYHIFRIEAHPLDGCVYIKLFPI